VNSEMTKFLTWDMTDLPRQLANLLSGQSSQRRKLAEREGFEPPGAFAPAVFKTVKLRFWLRRKMRIILLWIRYLHKLLKFTAVAEFAISGYYLAITGHNFIPRLSEKSVPPSSKCVANECRSTCGVTRFVIPALAAAFRIAF
jgi:hypothetical protein